MRRPRNRSCGGCWHARGRRRGKGRGRWRGLLDQQRLHQQRRRGRGRGAAEVALPRACSAATTSSASIHCRRFACCARECCLAAQATSAAAAVGNRNAAVAANCGHSRRRQERGCRRQQRGRGRQQRSGRYSSESRARRGKSAEGLAQRGARDTQASRIRRLQFLRVSRTRSRVPPVRVGREPASGPRGGLCALGGAALHRRLRSGCSVLLHGARSCGRPRKHGPSVRSVSSAGLLALRRCSAHGGGRRG